MMQAAVDPDLDAQTSIDMEAMNYERIIARGFPFMPVERVNVNQDGVDIRHEVERACVDSGTPIILEGWHLHPKWNSEMFTFPHIEHKYGNNEILCRDLRLSEDVKMLMREYIREVHADSLAPLPALPNMPRESRSYEFALTPASTSAATISEEELASSSGDEAAVTKEASEDTIMETSASAAPEKVPEVSMQGALSPPPLIDTAASTEPNPMEPNATDAKPAERFAARMAIGPVKPRSRAKSTSQTLQPDLPPLLYAKDVTCPEDWREFLMVDALPQFLGYLRENDLNTLNTRLAAENLMIYIGQAGTWTPAHIDQCGAIGHNIMTWADDDSSSIWFMVRAQDKDKAEALWRSFGHPLEYEGYFASVEELSQATFPIYVVEQKIGDFVMVPSLSYHQVVNLGKATIKVSWNRLTAHCLKAAINIVLPRYREIARPEGYRIKTIIKSALEAWTNLLLSQPETLPLPQDQFCQSYKDILELFRIIVEEEWVDMDIVNANRGLLPNRRAIIFKKPRRLSESMPAVCDFCSMDLWNRQFHCSKCADHGDDYDICTRCFSLGRGCLHRATSMEFVETFSMNSCKQLYSNAIRAWNESKALEGCTGYEMIEDEWSEGIVPSLNKDFSLTTVAYFRQESYKLSFRSCHRCKNRNQNYASVRCSTCQSTFCERCFYRIDNLLWIDIVSRRGPWTCPRCTGDCACLTCDRAKGIAHLRGTSSETKKPEIVRRPLLTFTRPEEDERNRGGLADRMNQSFKAVEEDGTESEEEDPNQEDGDEGQGASDAEYGARTGKGMQRKRSKQQADGPSRDTKKRRPNTINRWIGQSKSSSLSAPWDHRREGKKNGAAGGGCRMSQEDFERILGVQDEMAVRYLVSNNMWRTLQSIQTEQPRILKSGNYYLELFRMDAYWQSKDRDVLHDFRRDILESYSAKKKLQEASNTKSDGHVNSNHAGSDLGNSNSDHAHTNFSEAPALQDGDANVGKEMELDMEIELDI